VDSADGIGSKDLANALNTLPHANEFINIPDELVPGEDVVKLKRDQQSNSSLASRYIQAVILSRLLLFRSFLSVFASPNLSDQELKAARRQWLLLQLFPSAFFSDRKDVFAFLSAQLWRMKANDISEMLDEVRAEIYTWIPSKFYTVIDECQVAAVAHPRWFVSDKGSFSRPLLRQVLRDVDAALPDGASIVSGTGLSNNMVQEAIGSFVSKDTGKADLHKTGAFDEKGRFNSYVEKYLASSLDELLLDRLWLWLRGRYDSLPDQ
jgi:hypothetical protein